MRKVRNMNISAMAKAAKLFAPISICLSLSLLMPVELHAESNPDEVRTLISKANNGDAKAAMSLSNYYGVRNATQYDQKRADEWLLRAAKLGSVPAIVSVGYPKPYIAHTALKCGQTLISVETVCTSVDKSVGNALCYSQRFLFSVEGRKVEHLLINRGYRTNEVVATEIACVEKSNSAVVKIASTNFGSGMTCTDCERDDYFSSKGEYLGSTPSRTGMQIVFQYRALRKPVLERLEKDFREGVEKKASKEISIHRFPASID
jgi:TPR repeat protein